MLNTSSCTAVGVNACSKEKQVKNKPTPPKSCSVNTMMPSITMSNHGIYQTSAFTLYILIVTACYSTIIII